MGAAELVALLEPSVCFLARPIVRAVNSMPEECSSEGPFDRVTADNRNLSVSPPTPNYMMGTQTLFHYAWFECGGPTFRMSRPPVVSEWYQIVAHNGVEPNSCAKVVERSVCSKFAHFNVHACVYLDSFVHNVRDDDFLRNSNCTMLSPDRGYVELPPPPQ